MSNGKADQGVLDAYDMYARSIASSPVIDYASGVVNVSKEMQKLGKAGGDLGVAVSINERRKELEKAKQQQKLIDDFNNKVKELQDKASTLPENEKKDLVAKLEQEAIEYGNSLDDPQAMSNIMNNLDVVGLQIENVAVFKGEFIKAVNTPESDGGLTDRFRTSDMAKEYAGILDGSTEMDYIDGEYKFLLSSEEKKEENEARLIELNNELEELNKSFDFGGIVDDQEYFDKQLEITNQISEVQNSIDTGSKDWFSHYDMKKVIDENSFDKFINNTITQVAKDARKFGKEGMSFESIPDIDTIAVEIVKEGNLKSLILDSHIKGLDNNGEERTFKQDLFDSIFLGPEGEGTKWTDLGLDEETIAALDPNTDGDPSIVGEQDAWSIVESIIDDEKLATRHVAEYLYMHFKKQWEKGNKEYLANV